MAPIGRPTKYGSELQAKAKDYVEACFKESTTPYIEELALLLDVNDDTIVEWSKEHDEFSATIKRLKMLQKLNFKRDAIEKRIQPTMAIFLLKANHGLNEKEPDVERESLEINVQFIDADGSIIKSSKSSTEVSKGSSF